MSRRSVLVVDDDVDIREVLTDTLSEVGFDVVTASNGLEALAVIRRMRVRPSVILLDLMMPVMDGYGFLEQRKSDPALASIPIAVVTAGRGIDRERLGAGLEVVPKPFDVPRLLGVLDAIGSKGDRPA